MKNQKQYEADDKMITLIRDNYDLLQALGSFGISLGFGDKTVRETCEDNDVDTYTFLAVVNFTINGYGDYENDEQLSVPTLMLYLDASHKYYLDFQLPFIRKELEESLSPGDSLAQLILRFYDEYAHEIRRHMMYEQKTLFPYVQALLDGKTPTEYSIETFSKHHKARHLRQRGMATSACNGRGPHLCTRHPPPGAAIEAERRDEEHQRDGTRCRPECRCPLRP